MEFAQYDLNVTIFQFTLEKSFRAHNLVCVHFLPQKARFDDPSKSTEMMYDIKARFLHGLCSYCYLKIVKY